MPNQTAAGRAAVRIALATAALGVAFPTAVLAGPINLTNTTDPATLAAALGAGGGLTITSIVINNGATSQFGTISNFNVTLDGFSGVVLSTGQILELLPSFNNGLGGGFSTPSTETFSGGTPEFDAYGASHILNFTNSNDVAAMTVNFDLASASQLTFEFVFGSIEYPEFTNLYTDTFLAFLDGLGDSNQLALDEFSNPIQVGLSFASSLVTYNTDTAFSNPHGLQSLTMRSSTLAAGSHSIRFEVGDVNDTFLDSAVFLSSLRAESGVQGAAPRFIPGGPASVPEPTTILLVGSGCALVVLRRRLTRRP